VVSGDAKTVKTTKGLVYLLAKMGYEESGKIPSEEELQATVQRSRRNFDKFMEMLNRGEHKKGFYQVS